MKSLQEKLAQREQDFKGLLQYKEKEWIAKEKQCAKDIEFLITRLSKHGELHE